MTNAERQRRYCERPYPSYARRTARRGRSSGPTPSASSVPCRPNTRSGATSCPEPLADSPTAELLEGVCGVDPRQSSYREASAAAERSWRTTPHAGIMENCELMLDTHAVARSLTAADFTPAQADALTDALRLVVEQGDHVTSDQFKAGMAEMRAHQRTEIAEVRTEIAEVRTEIANLDTRLSTQISTAETRLTWRMLGIAGLVIAALRLLG